MSISQEVERRAGPGAAVRVVDIRGIHRQDEVALRGGQTRQAADRVRVTRNELERNAAVDQVGPAVVGQRQRARAQAAGVDRLAEGDVDGRHGRIPRVGRDRGDRGDGEGMGDDVGDGAAGAVVVAVARERPGVGVGAGDRMGGAAQIQEAAQVRGVRGLDARGGAGGGVRVAVVADGVRCDHDHRVGLGDRFADDVRWAALVVGIAGINRRDRIRAAGDRQGPGAEGRLVLAVLQDQRAAADLIGRCDRAGVKRHRARRGPRAGHGGRKHQRLAVDRGGRRRGER